MSSIKEALKRAAKHISHISDTPQKEARILLSYHLKKDEKYLFLHEDEAVDRVDEFEELFKRRADGEPIEYITKKVSFYSEDFFIDKGALIPRPETELLIDRVLEVQKEIKKRPINIAEIGVGSGVISIMLAKMIKDANIIATDISNEALKIAKTNIKLFGLEDRVELVKGAYLDGVDAKIDILVSNPPYVANGFRVEKPLEYEPKEAIFGGVRGDEVLVNIIKLAKQRGVRYLVCEMGYDQRESIEKALKEFGFEEFSFYKDLAGLDRGFLVKG